MYLKTIFSQLLEDDLRLSENVGFEQDDEIKVQLKHADTFHASIIIVDFNDYEEFLQHTYDDDTSNIELTVLHKHMKVVLNNIYERIVNMEQDDLTTYVF